MLRRVVLDTMVWVQALSARATRKPSPAAAILNLALEGAILLVASPYIRSEVVEVIAREPYYRKRLAPGFDVAGVFDTAMVACGSMIDATGTGLVLEDAKDDPILWAAGAGLASHLVTRDEVILNLKHYRHARIITPEEFLREERGSKVSEPLSGWKAAMRVARRRPPRPSAEGHQVVVTIA